VRRRNLNHQRKRLKRPRMLRIRMRLKRKKKMQPRMSLQQKMKRRSKKKPLKTRPTKKLLKIYEGCFLVPINS